MTALIKLIAMEGKLLLREPATLVFTTLLPLGLMLIFGLGFSDSEPATGQRGEPLYLPAMSLMIAIGMLGFFGVPTVLGAYREKGVLRRLSTTPVHPATLLVAQLVVQLISALLTVTVLIMVTHAVLGLPYPQNLGGFVLAVALGLTSLFAVGLVVAALSPTARIAGSVGPLLFFPMLFLAGTWLPRDLMPDVLAQIGAYSPLGALIDTVGASWAGADPNPAQLAVMAALAVVLSTVAARVFRWE